MQLLCSNFLRICEHKFLKKIPGQIWFPLPFEVFFMVASIVIVLHELELAWCHELGKQFLIESIGKFHAIADFLFWNVFNNTI